jgi:protein tyrosine phosphatase (PTP) superfamily phosphohydrolase (DUF442 family)
MLDTLIPSEPAPTRTPALSPPTQPLQTRLIVKCLVLAAVVMFVAECLRIFVGSNFHDVVPGKCYRSAQPTAQFLETAHNAYGIRSIVNLRDENEDAPWYQQEKHAAERLGVTLLNAGLSSKEQPPDVDFHTFVQAMKDAPEPILIHCANGNDRTGLAAAVYLMMRTKTPMPEARGHLSLRYGHFAVGKALCLHRILDSYEAWLQDNGWEHSADRFYYWGMNVYRQEVIRRFDRPAPSASDGESQPVRVRSGLVNSASDAGREKRPPAS